MLAAGGGDNTTYFGEVHSDIPTTATTTVIVRAPPMSLVQVGLTDPRWMLEENPSDGGHSPMYDDCFELIGLSDPANQLMRIPSSGEARFQIRGNLPPEGIAYVQALVTGRCIYTAPNGFRTSIEVTPGRIATAGERIANGMKDYALGFVWGETASLAGVAGTLTMGFMPGISALGDGRDILREICRFAFPGGDDGDLTILGLAAFGLVTEFIPFVGQGLNPIIATAKTSLQTTRTVLRLVKNAGPALSRVLLTGHRRIVAMISRFDVVRLERLLITNGYLDFLFYAHRKGIAAGPVVTLEDWIAVSALTAGEELHMMSLLARHQRGVRMMGVTLKNFDDVTESLILDGVLQAGRLSRSSITRSAKVMEILSENPQLPKLFEAMEPDQIARCLGGIIKIAHKTDIDPNRIVQMIARGEQKWGIFDHTLTGASATSKSLPDLLDDMGVVVDNVEGGAKLAKLVSAIPYPAPAHGFRFELDDAADFIRNGDTVINGRRLDVPAGDGAKGIISDVDNIVIPASGGLGMARNLKRQATTMNRWAGDNPAKLGNWLVAAGDIDEVGEVVIVLGKGGIDDLSPVVKEAIDSAKDAGVIVRVETKILLPPPAIN